VNRSGHGGAALVTGEAQRLARLLDAARSCREPAAFVPAAARCLEALDGVAPLPDATAIDRDDGRASRSGLLPAPEVRLPLYRDATVGLDLSHGPAAAGPIAGCDRGGAVRVAAGAALYIGFEFLPAGSLAPGLDAGQLRVVEVRQLGPGAVQPLAAGATVAHALYRLATPTALLHLHDHPAPGAAHRYLRPLRPRPTLRRRGTPAPEMQERLDALEVLRRSDEAGYRHRLLALAGELPLPDLVALFERNLPHLARPAEFVPVYLVAERHHGPVARCLPAVFDEQRRRAAVMREWSHGTGAGERLLLALLAAAPGASHILRLLAEGQPGADPVTLLVAQLHALCARVDDDSDSLLCLDELSLDTLEALLRAGPTGDPLAQLQQRYAAETIEASRDELIELCDAIRGSDLLSPLFHE
jgi:hypothetical protein